MCYVTKYCNVIGPYYTVGTRHVCSVYQTLFQGATVTKLPDTKPLKLVGCYTPWGKRVLGKAIWSRRDFHTFRPLLGHFYTVITTL